ncbi:MAG: DUF1329 domain-containing protein [Desulfuromonadaceae bacterium]|nr:DUF1329 domain-containing protein [Desulfuromonadaceae bacterium]
MRNKILFSTAYLILLSTMASAATLADVENSFYPYKKGVPQVAGIKPGMVINSKNWQIAKDALEPAFQGYIQKGNYEIKVGETTSFDQGKTYIEQTKARLNKAKLGDKPGEITGSDAGRPFPEEPSLSDPRAGDKLAWNFKYGFSQGDDWSISPWYWKFRNMKTDQIERSLIFDFHIMKFTHRSVVSPIPALKDNPSNIFRANYFKALEPFDIKNTQVLIQRFEEDTKLDDSYLYLGFQRRVRRMSSGQTTDAFLGSDITIEDFEGYNGRISDMKWTYMGTKTLLVPFYNHNDMPLDKEMYKGDKDGFKMIAGTGKGGCFPAVTWQLRKVYILESKPLDKNHPVSKRIHYMDAQTAVIPLTSIYDRSGKLWKSFTIAYTHADNSLPQNKGTGTTMYDFTSLIDTQADHCTTGHFKTMAHSPATTRALFTVENMRSSGK